MKLRQLYVLGLIFAFAVAMCGAAFAADAPASAAPAAKPAPAAATPTAKDGPKGDAKKKPAEEMVKCTVKGKVETKMVKNKKGAEVKAFTVTVNEAKSDDGKVMEKLKGKTLRIVGQKDLDKFVGKDVEIKGETNGKRIKAASVK